MNPFGPALDKLALMNGKWGHYSGVDIEVGEQRLEIGDRSTQ